MAPHIRLASRRHINPRDPFNAFDWLMGTSEAAGIHSAFCWIGTSWIMEVTASGTRDGMPFLATNLSLTNLRTTPEVLLQQVRVRWSIEGWHWPH